MRDIFVRISAFGPPQSSALPGADVCRFGHRVLAVPFRPSRRPLPRLEPPLNALTDLLGLRQAGPILDRPKLLQNLGLDHEGATFLHSECDPAQSTATSVTPDEKADAKVSGGLSSQQEKRQRARGRGFARNYRETNDLTRVVCAGAAAPRRNKNVVARWKKSLSCRHRHHAKGWWRTDSWRAHIGRGPQGRGPCCGLPVSLHYWRL